MRKDCEYPVCDKYMNTLKQFNNITERVIDDLKQALSSGDAQISVAAASFSIYAYEALKEELEKVECVNFIFTSPTFTTDRAEKQKREFYIPRLNRERSLFGSDFEIRLRNQLTQRAIARECADWKQYLPGGCGYARPSLHGYFLAEFRRALERQGEVSGCDGECDRKH